jgi:predicted small lipoprotein YifL
MKNRLYMLCLLAILPSLAACAPLAGPLAAVPPAPAQTQLPTATSLPATVTLQLPRWKYWERALGDILNGPSGNTHPDLSQDHGRCEWDIYGRSDTDVYVWAYCELYQKGLGVTASSGPAIVRLAQDGSISEVISPEDTAGMRTLVPADIWLRITKRDFDVAGAQKDIGLRLADPTLPPLIIQQGVQLP